MKLEPLHSALNYYLKYDIHPLVLQKKYMGSRCQVYFSKDNWKILSRNCNILFDSNDLTKRKIPINLYDILEKYRTEVLPDLYNNPDFVILDCELVPWHLIAKDLIGKSFYNQYYAIKSILNGKKIFGEITDKEYSLRQNLLERYKQQIDIYAIDDYTHATIEPFYVLLVNDRVMITEYNNIEHFTIFNKYGVTNRQYGKDYIVWHPDEYNAANEFFNTVSEDLCEGIVVKPLITWNKKMETDGIVPYLKVRNPEYLRIIYGYDYDMPDRLAELVATKSVRKKMTVSFIEWILSLKMLEVYAQNNTELLIDLYKKFAYILADEEKLDNRL